MFFHITHYIFQLFVMAANYHVYMARHYTPAINFEALILLTMPPRIQQDILIFITDKQINPVYNREGYKIQLFLIAELVFGTHYKFKYRKKT